MIKNTLIGFTALFLVSCTQVNTSSDNAITQGGDTVAEVDISLSKLDAVEELANIEEPKEDKILFKASGTEPGWFAEISELKLRLVVDYGKDSLIVSNKFEGLDNKDGYILAMGENDPKTNLSLNIINKPCTAASGDKADRQVTVLFKGKKYTGCGSFVK
jgi:uncharacterized membrane protein